jgi:hypothetical protein
MTNRYQHMAAVGEPTRRCPIKLSLCEMASEIHGDEHLLRGFAKKRDQVFGRRPVDALRNWVWPADNMLLTSRKANMRS